ncbi:hypothetical protein STEG23_027228 [Scotinomys teguina]
MPALHMEDLPEKEKLKMEVEQLRKEVKLQRQQGSLELLDDVGEIAKGRKNQELIRVIGIDNVKKSHIRSFVQTVVSLCEEDKLMNKDERFAV